MNYRDEENNEAAAEEFAEAREAEAAEHAEYQTAIERNCINASPDCPAATTGLHYHTPGTIHYQDEVTAAFTALRARLTHLKAHHMACECMECGAEDCVWKEPLHYDDDGCPAEYAVECENKRLTQRIAELETQNAGLAAALREGNAVCVCGCLDSAHEDYGEDGEDCGVEGHECMRTYPAMVKMLNGIRSEIDHWRVKARCYGDIVSGCSPALAAAGFPVDATRADGAVGGIRRAVEQLAAARMAAERQAEVAVHTAAEVIAERDVLRERLASAERERDEARGTEAKWRKEMEAASELMERYRSIVQAALNEPPEYHYDHHDNGSWSAEHAAHTIRALFTQRDEAQARLRLLAHVEDNAVELVELRAEKARHGEELARAAATLRDAERDAAAAREEAKRLADLLVEYHDALGDLASGGVTFDDTRLKYIIVHADRTALDTATALLVRWPKAEEVRP